MMIKDKIDYQRERRIRHRIIAKSVFNTRILCPDSYRSRWSGMAFHSLLQRRSAPRKVVRLLPDKRGRLTFRILPFVFKQRGRLVKWRFLFLLRSRQIFCVSHFFIFCFYSYKNRLFDRRFFFFFSVFKDSWCYSPRGTVFPLFSTK